jgi:hypothetical protein
VAHPLVRRLISPAGLVLVAVGFVLPFAAVSCDTPVKVTAQYTGTDLLVGGTPSVSVSGEGVSQQDTEEVSDEPIDVQPAAVLAMLAILAGILVAVLPGDRLRVLGGAAAAGATLVLLIVNQILVHGYLSREVEQEVGPSMPEGSSGGDFVSARYGFWLAVSFASLVVLFQAVELYRLYRKPRDLAALPPPA